MGGLGVTLRYEEARSRLFRTNIYAAITLLARRLKRKFPKQKNNNNFLHCALSLSDPMKSSMCTLTSVSIAVFLDGDDHTGPS